LCFINKGFGLDSEFKLGCLRICWPIGLWAGTQSQPIERTSHPLFSVLPRLGFHNRNCEALFSSSSAFGVVTFHRSFLLSSTTPAPTSLNLMAPPPGPYSGASTLALVCRQLPFSLLFSWIRVTKFSDNIFADFL